MYLNVNLTPPQSGGTEGSCTHTPKTPEILNSLISLSSASIPSYANYQSQATHGDLLSPASSSASPSEETAGTQFGTPTSSGGSGLQMSPTSSSGSTSDPGGGGGEPGSASSYPLTTRLSGAFRGMPAVAGTPSPPVPELPSPISTVEATKSALIKEGLKHQIKTKLQAAGLAPCELLPEAKIFKEESSDCREDEERRMRRRERNKIAATKCRNKKKEKTFHLMTESESVEDQNLRLKSEIQRLTSEKLKLKKLLDDPSHVASCRHSCRSSNHSHTQPPLVVVTSPDAPEMLLSSSADGTVLSTSVGESLDGIRGGSDQSPEISSAMSFRSHTNRSSTCEAAFVSHASPPSYVSLISSSPSSSSSTSSSAISPCSLPSVSPPQLTMPPKQFSPRTTSHSYMPQSVPSTATTYSNDASLLSLSYSSLPSSTTSSTNRTTTSTTINDSSSNSTLPVPTSEPLSIYPPVESPPSANHFLSPRSSSKLSSHQHHHPYTLNRSPGASPYPAEGTAPALNPADVQGGGGCRDYCCYFPSSKEEPSQFVYPPPLNPSSSGALALSPLEPVSCSSSLSPPSKAEYVAGKARVTLLSSHASSLCRYTPYDRANRQLQHHNPLQPSQPPQPHQLSPHHHTTSLHNADPTTLPQSCAEVAAALETLHQHSSYTLIHNNVPPDVDTYLPASCNASASCQFMGEAPHNQFYPSCTYGNVASFNDLT